MIFLELKEFTADFKYLFKKLRDYEMTVFKTGNSKTYIKTNVTISEIIGVSLLSNNNMIAVMSEKEIRETKKVLKKVKKNASNKEYSISILKEIGILTKSGKVAEQYETLCTPSRQD